MADGAHTHECPYRELKFLDINQVRDHLITGHPTHAAAFLALTPTEAEPRPHHGSA